MRSFRRHSFRCSSFSAQIVSAPIPCSLTVQLFRVEFSQKALNIGAEKVRAEMVAPKSRGPVESLLNPGFIPELAVHRCALGKDTTHIFRWGEAVDSFWWRSLTKACEKVLALVWLDRRIDPGSSAWINKGIICLLDCSIQGVSYSILQKENEKNLKNQKSNIWHAGTCFILVD